MGKKIVLAVFGGIAIFGLLLAIVGFAMGGRPGSFTVREGQVVYTAGGEKISLGLAPQWLNRSWWRSRQDSGEIAASRGAAPGAPTPSGSTGRTGGTAANIPFTASQLKEVEIDISAGIIVVQTGDAPGLTVEGPLEYTSTFEDGEWEIRSIYESELFRFFGRRVLQGETDMTTTFTITLPATLQEIDLNIDMGEARVSGFTLKQLECSTSMGSITVSGMECDEAKFSVDMGGIEVTDCAVGEAKLNCSLGSLKFQGVARNSLEADCDLGGIEIRLSKPASYAGKAEVSLGGITVDGRSQPSGKFDGTFPESSLGHRLKLELECGLGGIDLKFV